LPEWRDKPFGAAPVNDLARCGCATYLVDGHFSVFRYLDALAGAYDGWRRVAGVARDAEPLARTCYHVPYGKMARKAHRHRRMMDGLGEADADASFAVEVGSSLRLPAQGGSVYTGSLYLALASRCGPWRAGSGDRAGGAPALDWSTPREGRVAWAAPRVRA
jgi:3-hydroxy-3-methylglutaryl CoA synthase